MPHATRRFVLLLWLFTPLALGAQQSALVAADSLAARGDTAAALALLDRAVRERPGDAALWHERGMLAWALSREARRKEFIRDIRDIRRIEAADTSLQRAHALAPDSARFALDLGRFYTAANLSTLRLAALRYYDRAVDVARRTGDTLLLADALDARGMVYWRRYESVAHRYLTPQLPGVQLEPYVFDEKGLRNFLESYAQPVSDFTGELDYFKASDDFSAALRLRADHPAALRHAFMALADRKRWEELGDLARLRLGAAPWDPWAWLGRGLASHRRNDEADAAAAFDSAMVLLLPADRARFTRLSRLLRPTAQRGKAVSDSLRWAQASPAQRARIERLYWAISDPLALTPQNEYRLEFLSRVTYAELRFSNEEFGYHGADTERGDIYVRYGPPDSIYAFLDVGVSLVVWTYGEDLSFVFREPTAFGSATLYEVYADKATQMRELVPVRWKNVDLLKRLDTIPTQLVRFRAGDSTDVALFAQLPIGALTHGLDLARGAVDVDFRIYDQEAEVVRRDSSREVIATGEPTTASAVRGWRERVGRDAELWRVEAWQPDGGRAARASGVLVHDSGGFGLSDLLVAHNVLPRILDGPVRRWSDFNISPIAGAIGEAVPIALLWETYGLAGDAGGSRYRVALTFERVRGAGPIGLVARVASGVSEARGRSAKGRGKVTIQFERTVPTQPVTVDYLTLDVGDASPGQYRLQVTVTDLVSKRTATTIRTVRIVSPPKP